MELHVEDLGLLDYEEARLLQVQRLESRLRGESTDSLLLLEHPPVVTLGRGSHDKNVLPGNPFPVVECERGGDVTLHLPGQVVGYLIRLLEEGQRDLNRHLRLVEDILIGTLESFDLTGRRIEESTGVWVEDRKIASIGVACKRWCTWHGFALNVSCDLEHFRFINPCGFDAAVMTSLERELENPPDLPTVKKALGETARRLVVERTP